MRTISVPARTGVAVLLDTGEHLTVINTHGQQVVDFCAFADANEWVSMAHTHLHTGRTIPRPGDGLWSNMRRPLLTMVEDTSGGHHDTQIAACDPDRYRLLGADGHASCHANLMTALAGAELEIASPPPPLNLFMNVPIAPDGSLDLKSSTAPARSYVRFRAEYRVTVVASACPQDLIPISGESAVPRSVELRIE